MHQIMELSWTNNGDCIYQPNLVWNSELQFSSWWFNFTLEDSFSNSELQFFNSRIIWTWGIALELWVSILNVRIQFEIEDSILNCRLEIRILNLGFWIQEFRFWILDFGILDFGIRISGVRWGVWDFGLWFLFEIWILDFRFGNWDLWFWNLDFEFQFWNLAFAFGDLEFEYSNLDLGFWIWI